MKREDRRAAQRDRRAMIKARYREETHADREERARAALREAMRAENARRRAADEVLAAWVRDYQNRARVEREAREAAERETARIEREAADREGLTVPAWRELQAARWRLVTLLRAWAFVLEGVPPRIALILGSYVFVNTARPTSARGRVDAVWRQGHEIDGACLFSRVTLDTAPRPVRDMDEEGAPRK